MAQTLLSFGDEIRANIEEFERLYTEKHSDRGDEYPLAMEDGNEGLWLEFFMDFMRTGEV